jgi:hypothetical protein
MFDAKEIIQKNLKDGRDYILIGGRRYRPGDCLLNNCQELTVKQIIDPTHFMDGRSFCMHSHMYYDQNWQHCPERNADKPTKDRSPAAVVADRVREERAKFKADMIGTYPTRIYEEYEKIMFYEKMHWYIVSREHDPVDKANTALLKESDDLMAAGKGLLCELYYHQSRSTDRFSHGPKYSADNPEDLGRLLDAYLCVDENEME